MTKGLSAIGRNIGARLRMRGGPDLNAVRSRLQAKLEAVVKGEEIPRDADHGSTQSSPGLRGDEIRSELERRLMAAPQVTGDDMAEARDEEQEASE